jgi:hypothetical protein
MELVRVALRRPYTIAVLWLLELLLGGLAVTRKVLGPGLSAAPNAPIEEEKFGVFRM